MVKRESHEHSGTFISVNLTSNTRFSKIELSYITETMYFPEQTFKFCTPEYHVFTVITAVSPVKRHDVC